MLYLVERDNKPKFERELQEGVYSLYPGFPKEGNVGLNFKFLNTSVETETTLLFTLQDIVIEGDEDVDISNAILRDVVTVGGNSFRGNNTVFANKLVIQPVSNGEQLPVITIREREM